MKNYKYIYKHRRGTADQWKNSKIIPEEAELIVELDEENYKHKLKLGDGIHTYEDLSYLTAGGEAVTQTLARTVSVTLHASSWEEVVCESDPNIGYYKQTLNIDGIAANSKVDLQPTADMIAIFQSKNLAFVTETVIENNVPTIICYSIGSIPSNDYTLQATVTEVEIDGNNIIGNTVSTIPNLDDYATKSLAKEEVESALTQAKESGEFNGTSVTITNISESTEDDGNNIVTFSDGKTLTVQNGSQGVSGVYVGSGDMPEGYSVQIDPGATATELSQIEAPKIVSSVDEMTDTTKHYVLKDTNTIWAYMKQTVITEGTTVPNFTNVFNVETAMIGYRWSGSNKSPAALEHCILSDFIPCDLSSGEHTIRIKNGQLHGNTSNASISYFTSNTNASSFAIANHLLATPTEEADGVFAYKLGESGGTMISSYTDTRYIRCTIVQYESQKLVSPQTLENAQDVIITIDEPITYTSIPESTETYYEWVDTGISYTPTFKTDLIGVLGEGNMIYLSDNNLPSGTYTLKYSKDDYEAIGTYIVE